MENSPHNPQTKQSLQYKLVIRAYSEEIRKHRHSEREYKVWVRVSIKAGGKK